MKTKNLFLSGTLVLLFAACSNNEQLEPVPAVDDDAITFTSAISGNAPATRAYDDNWETDDAVGIFITSNDYSTILGQNNAKHIATYDDEESRWDLIADGDANKLYYPTGAETKVRFIAYYPYDATITTLGTYDVELDEQTATKTFDLLWYKNTDTAGEFVKGDQPSLEFKHMLSKIVINIERSAEVGGDDGVDIDDMGITLTGVPTTATFDLTAGTFELDIPNLKDVTTALTTPNILKEGDPEAEDEEEKLDIYYDRSHQAIIVPHQGTNYDGDTNPKRTLKFEYVDQLGGTATFTYTLADTRHFLSGKAHIYNFKIAGSLVEFIGATIEDWQDEIETTDGPEIIN